jgi:hypothetical protein
MLAAKDVFARHVVKKFPGMGKLMGQFGKDSTIAEQAASLVLAGSGLFKESHILQNTSGHGLDFIGKSQFGEWIPIEVKTSQGDRLTFSQAQAKGADSYTRLQLVRIGGSSHTFSAARMLFRDQASIADRIMREQLAYRNSQGQPYGFDGYVLGMRHLGQKSMKVGFRPWR